MRCFYQRKFFSLILCAQVGLTGIVGCGSTRFGSGDRSVPTYATLSSEKGGSNQHLVSTPHLLRIGNILVRQNQTTRAIDVYEEVLRREPQNQMALNELVAIRNQSVSPNENSQPIPIAQPSGTVVALQENTLKNNHDQAIAQLPPNKEEALPIPAEAFQENIQPLLNDPIVNDPIVNDPIVNDPIVNLAETAPPLPSTMPEVTVSSSPQTVSSEPLFNSLESEKTSGEKTSVEKTIVSSEQEIVNVETTVQEFSASSENQTTTVASKTTVVQITTAEPKINALEIFPKSSSVLAEKQSPDYIDWLTHADAEKRAMGAFFLGRQNEKAKKAVPHLERALNAESTGWVRVRMAEAIARIDATNKAAVESLTEWLGAKKLRTRWEAVCVIDVVGRFGLPIRQRAVEQLIKNLDDAHPNLQTMAALKLAEFGTSANSAVPHLQRVSQETETEIGEAAAASLDVLQATPAQKAKLVPNAIPAPKPIVIEEGEITEETTDPFEALP